MSSKSVEIGGVRLEPGRMPAICVPVPAYGVVEVMHQAERIADSPGDIVELRADYLTDEAYLNSYTVGKTIEALKEHLPDRPVLFTLRTKREGGEAQVDEEQYIAVCGYAIDTGKIDAIDVEFSHREATVKKIVDHAHEHDVKVIMSSHNFRKTPEVSEMTDKMKKMAVRGADIAKTAVMPADDGDVFRVEAASEELKTSLDIPFIMIAMGPAGASTRISGEQSGSVMTFGTVGLSSAPGQIDADDLDRAMRVLHMARARKKPKPPLDIKERNIVLGGFMGTGKSSTAKKIALYADYKVVEMDDLIEKKEKMTIPEIFEKHGEAYFRKAEEEVCEEISQMTGVVVSTGGGTLLRPENVERLRKNGYIVVLESSPDTVFSRLSVSRRERPVLKGHMNRGYISWLMKQRQDAYSAAADMTLDASHLTPGNAAVEILSLLGIIPS